MANFERLNFSRNLATELAQRAKTGEWKGDEKLSARMASAFQLLMIAPKFMLPFGGYVIHDSEYRGLDEREPLRLPFPVIALEYRGEMNCHDAHGNKWVEIARRVLVVIENSELTVDGRQCLGIYPWASMKSYHGGRWSEGVILGLPEVDYLRRPSRKGDPMGFMVTAGKGEEPDINDAAVVVGMLNAMACSNVQTDVVPPIRPDKNEKLIAQGALPFDSYHVLTIESPRRAGDPTGDSRSHRSPREHLRRGFIRRLASGKRVWVNATIVNPGAPGRIVKDYEVHA